MLGSRNSSAICPGSKPCSPSLALQPWAGYKPILDVTLLASGDDNAHLVDCFVLLFTYLLFILCSTGDRIQGLVHGGQAFSLSSYAPHFLS
jgi:hypothetical protein